MTQKIVQIVLVSFILIACNKNAANSNVKMPITIVVNQNEATKINFSEVFDSVKYVVLETSDDILLNEITRVKYYDSCIYVLDKRTQTLFSFSLTGKMNWKIQDTGQGPNEYLYLRDFDIDRDGKKIYLFSTFDKILVYNLDGKFLHTLAVKLSGTAFAINRDTMYMFTGGIGNPTGGMDRGYDIIRINSDQKLKGYMPNKNGLETMYVYNSSNAFCKVKNDLRFFKPFSTNIYTISKDTTKIQYRFDFGEYNMPENYFDDYTPKDLSESKYAYALNSYWENNSYCCFEITYNQKPHTILYNKNNKVLHDGLYDDLAFCFPQIHEVTDDFLLGCRSVEELLMEYNYKKIDRKGTVLESVISQIDEDDNPVVFFYYFKTVEK